MDILISSDKLIKELKWVLKMERESLEMERQSPEEDTYEHFVDGAADAIEGVLDLIEELKQDKEMLSDTLKTLLRH